MSRILFTGGSRNKSGGYLVGELRTLGHKVITLGMGSSLTADFRFLSSPGADASIKEATRHLKGLPDVIVHNARVTETTNFGHALHVNVTARTLLDLAMLKLTEGAAWRSIHILGWKPEWAEILYQPLVSKNAQLALPLALIGEANKLHYEHLHDLSQIEVEKLAHSKNAARLRKEHEQTEKLNIEYAERAGVDYEAKGFTDPEFYATIEPRPSPKVTAVSIAPRDDHLANGRISREDVLAALCEALTLELEPLQAEHITVTEGYAG